MEQKAMLAIDMGASNGRVVWEHGKKTVSSCGNSIASKTCLSAATD